MECKQGARMAKELLHLKLGHGLPQIRQCSLHPSCAGTGDFLLSILITVQMLDMSHAGRGR